MDTHNDSGLELNILKGAVENTNEAFITIDEDSTVIFFNKAAEKIFGYSRDEVLGRDLGLILDIDCREGHKKAVANYLATRRPKLLGHETEFMAMRRDGSLFPASISFSVAQISGKFFFTGIIRDLTETRTLEEQVSRAEHLSALGKTMAEISHEIKNPLVMIGGFARQLLNTVQKEKNHAKLKIIADEVRRLERLLLGMNDLYMPRRLVPEKFDMFALLREVYALVKEDCELRGIDFLLKTEGASYAMIEGDREKLKQVLLNVIKNGMEALPGGGYLVVEAQSKDDVVEIAVIDSGQGIPPDVQKKLFTPFFTTKSQGTGLGLCVSKRIVEEHRGGEFVLKSDVGKGTTVRISLAHRRD